MKDIDGLLRDSLGRAGRSLGPVAPEGAHGRLAVRRRGRTRLRFVAVTSTVALVIAGTGVYVASQERTVQNVLGPGPSSSVPQGEMIVTARIPVGDRPTSIDADGDKVFVGHAEGGRVDVIDPLFDKSAEASLITPGRWGTEDRFQSEHFVVEDGRFWAAGGGWLTHGLAGPGNEGISPENLVWAHPPTIPTGNVRDLAIDTDAIYTAGPLSHDGALEGISEYKPADLTGDSETGVEIGGTPARIDVGLGEIWYTQRGHAAFGPDPKDGLFAIDFETIGTENRPSRQIEGVLGPTDVSVGAGAVWAYEAPVSDIAPHEMRALVRLDPSTGEVTRSLDESSRLGSDGLVEASNDLGVFALSVVGPDNSSLFRVDPVTGEALGDPLHLRGGPFSMTTGFDSLWIAAEGEDLVYRIEINAPDDTTAADKNPTKDPADDVAHKDDFVTVEIDTDPPPGVPEEGCLAGPTTPEEDREWVEFIKGTEPTRTCPEPEEQTTGEPPIELEEELEGQLTEAEIRVSIEAAQPGGLPERIDDWIRPTLVLLYRDGDEYHAFFEEVQDRHGPCIDPEEGCELTAFESTFGPEGNRQIVNGADDEMDLPEDLPNGAVVLWRGEPSSGSIGVQSPGACDRIERWAPVYECKNGEVVYKIIE